MIKHRAPRSQPIKRMFIIQTFNSNLHFHSHAELPCLTKSCWPRASKAFFRSSTHSIQKRHRTAPVFGKPPTLVLPNQNFSTTCRCTTGKPEHLSRYQQKEKQTMATTSIQTTLPGIIDFFSHLSRYVEFPNVLGLRLHDHAVVDPTSCATPRWHGASHLALSTSLGRLTLRSWMSSAPNGESTKPSTSRHGKKFYQNKILEVKRDFGILLFQRVKKQNSSTILFNNFCMSNLVSRKRAGCLSIFHIQPSIFNNLHSTTRHQNNGESTHTLEESLQLAQLVDKERSQTSPTLWPLTTHLQLASKERWHFPACSKNQQSCEKKKHQNPPEPPATFGEFHLPRFRIPSRCPSRASLAARSHSAIRGPAVVFVVLGPSQRRGRTTERKPPCRKSRAIRGAAPAASYSTSPLPARARAVFGSPKNLSNLNSTCQRVKILLPTGALLDIWHIWLTKLDDVKLRTSNKTAQIHGRNKL